MDFDIFFSISQTPVDGETPTEAVMFRNFFDQVAAADRLGYGTAWVAESHLSSEIQKRNTRPVVPHWKGEIGLNTDIFQLAHRVFATTKRIEVGSAVMSVLCNGGPIAAAERTAAFLALHGLDPDERRRLNVGFAAGRFEFVYRATGIVPRNPVEEAAWPALKGKIFAEAAEIFCKLLRGDVLASDAVAETVLTRKDFRSDEDWARVREAAHDAGAERVPIAPRWSFEEIKVVPQDFRSDLFQLIAGSHDPAVQAMVNAILPVQVFNLSITKPEVIEATHERMTRCYHADGGPWKRAYMPRTSFVFINEEPGLSPEARRKAAAEEARAALGAYWTALEGTLDPKKVENAADNALVGNADDVAAQAVERFHADDRLMLWFDFFNHDNDRVIRNMEAFMNVCAPKIQKGCGRS